MKKFEEQLKLNLEEEPQVKLIESSAEISQSETGEICSGGCALKVKIDNQVIRVTASLSANNEIKIVYPNPEKSNKLEPDVVEELKKMAREEFDKTNDIKIIKKDKTRGINKKTWDEWMLK